MKHLRQWSGILLITLCLGMLFLVGCQSEQTKTPAKPAETAEQKPAEPVRSSTDPGEMILIPAGEFILGLGKDAVWSPEQKMYLPAFYIDKYEVTMAQYMKFSVESGYVSQGNWRTLFSPEKANFPVTNISWKDATEYAKWAGKRLPTEFEWEKAARGDKGFRYPWGNEWEGSRANTFESGVKDLVAVGTYQGDVSPYGVVDMLGNALEWTGSNYEAYKGSTKKDKDFGNVFRVVRGCDYVHYGGPKQGQQFHLAYRGYYLPDALFNFGFRCAKDAEATATK